MRHSGFTLIELLVVVIIMLILTAITVTSVNSMLAGDRTRSAARQLQSYLEGARDRAIYRREPVGVRFLLSDDELRTVESLVFVAPSEPFDEGWLRIERDAAGDPTIVKGFHRDPEGGGEVPTEYLLRLRRQGLLLENSRLRINRRWYPIAELPTVAEPNRLRLASNYRGSAMSNTQTPGALVARIENGDWELTVEPSVMPNQEPTLLARGIAVDLRESRVPPSWSVDPHLDIMFSPRGTVTGATAAAGVVHFLLTDVSDIEHNRGLPRTDPAYQRIGDQRKEREEILVTIFTHTGHIAAFRVDDRDEDQDGIADDPFRFAETGEAAK